MTDSPPAVVPIQANGIASEEAGVRQQNKGFKPPQPGTPGMLNKEMAEAAAMKYNKDKKKIRKACAELEPGTKAGCSCAIM
jgi:hypothetical protein